MRRTRAAFGAGTVLAGVAAWSLFESQWVELRRVEVGVPGLPSELDGLRVLHLSDFHLGKRSLNGRALEKALLWAEGCDAELVAITGDLLTRRRGEKALEEAIARLASDCPVVAVLGNHDVNESRDPFIEPSDASRAFRTTALLLSDSARSLELRGVTVQLVGVDPAAFMRGSSRPEDLVDRSVPFRVLLSHFPDVVRRLPAEAFQLVLAGHTHGGQICIPVPGRKIRLENLGSRYWEGVYRLPNTVLHVSRGLGTSFVPFRFLARPEAAELVLRT